MKCLVVVAHPLPDSLCRSLARFATERLEAAGHQVTIEDLYDAGFDAALTEAERASYYATAFDASAVAGEAARLTEAEALVLVFPTWWYGFPAILKGWFDRVWSPGTAFDHAVNFGPIKPRLKLARVLAITTLGSPWWIDTLVLWQPVRRILRYRHSRRLRPRRPLQHAIAAFGRAAVSGTGDAVRTAHSQRPRHVATG